MKPQTDLLSIADRIRAIARNGQFYASNEYDKERYDELLDLSNRLTATLTATEIETVAACYTPATDYVTPKVDIRAVVFDDNERILLVRERADGKWSLPGGWGDIGFSPGEVAIKELREETGYEAIPLRLLAILDMRCHNHPPAPHYTYKIFIRCHITGGTPQTAFDTLEVGFFTLDSLPALSTERVTFEEIELMYEFLHNPQKEAVTD